MTFHAVGLRPFCFWTEWLRSSIVQVGSLEKEEEKAEGEEEKFGVREGERRRTKWEQGEEEEQQHTTHNTQHTQHTLWSISQHSRSSRPLWLFLFTANTGEICGLSPKPFSFPFFAFCCLLLSFFVRLLEISQQHQQTASTLVFLLTQGISSASVSNNTRDRLGFGFGFVWFEGAHSSHSSSACLNLPCPLPLLLQRRMARAQKAAVGGALAAALALAFALAVAPALAAHEKHSCCSAAACAESTSSTDGACAAAKPSPPPCPVVHGEQKGDDGVEKEHGANHNAPGGVVDTFLGVSLPPALQSLVHTSLFYPILAVITSIPLAVLGFVFRHLYQRVDQSMFTHVTIPHNTRSLEWFASWLERQPVVSCASCAIVCVIVWLCVVVCGCGCVCDYVWLSSVLTFVLILAYVCFASLPPTVVCCLDHGPRQEC